MTETFTKVAGMWDRVARRLSNRGPQSDAMSAKLRYGLTGTAGAKKFSRAAHSTATQKNLTVRYIGAHPATKGSKDMTTRKFRDIGDYADHVWRRSARVEKHKVLAARNKKLRHRVTDAVKGVRKMASATYFHPDVKAAMKKMIKNKGNQTMGSALHEKGKAEEIENILSSGSKVSY